MRLNIGSGKKELGFICLDLHSDCDVKADLEQGLPFKDNSFNEVMASHIIEHIFNLKQLQTELKRVCKKGAKLTVVSPYYLSPDAWGDPTHVRGISCQTFNPYFWSGFTLEGVQLDPGAKVFLHEPITHITAIFRRNHE